MDKLNALSGGDKAAILATPEFFDWFKRYTKANSPNAWWNNNTYKAYEDIEHEIGSDFGGTKMEELGVQWPIAFRKERDVRTAVDMFYAVRPHTDLHTKFNRRVLDVPHNGLHDCLHQINYLH